MNLDGRGALGHSERVTATDTIDDGPMYDPRICTYCGGRGTTPKPCKQCGALWGHWLPWLSKTSVAAVPTPKTEGQVWALIVDGMITPDHLADEGEVSE